MRIQEYHSSIEQEFSNNEELEKKENFRILNQDKRLIPQLTKKSIIDPAQLIQFKNNERFSFPNTTNRCKHCLTEQTLKTLTCKHRFCQKCIKNEFLKQTDLILEGKIRCWVCFNYLDFNLVYYALGGTANLQVLKEQLNYKVKIPEFQCEICYFNYSIEEFITLDCEHKFCKSCIIQHINHLVIEKKVTRSDFCCPKCKEYISPYIIKANCSEEVYEKYNNAFFDVYQPENASIAVKKCPFCGYLLEFNKSVTKIKCVKCRKTYCIYCSEYHYSENCAKKIQQNLKTQDFTIKSCPNCKEIVEKEQGCNFVQCPWPACHNFSFCYLCLKPLTKEEHYSHFPDGAYTDNCVTLEQINFLK